MNRYTKAPVGAHYGTGDWLLQRLTAVVMALYTLGMLVCIVVHRPAGYSDWKSIFEGGIGRVSTMLFFLALAYHAWVGMRDVVMDYVKPTGIRLAMETVIGGVLILYLIWAASILWGGR